MKVSKCQENVTDIYVSCEPTPPTQTTQTIPQSLCSTQKKTHQNTSVTEPYGVKRQICSIMNLHYILLLHCSQRFNKSTAIGHSPLPVVTQKQSANQRRRRLQFLYGVLHRVNEFYQRKMHQQHYVAISFCL